MVLRHLIAGLCVGLAVALLLASVTHIGLAWLIVAGIVAANLAAIGSAILDNARPKRRDRDAQPLPDPLRQPKR